MMNKKILTVLAFALVLIVGACPAFAASSASSTQQVQVTVSPTIAIAATWANGGNNSTIDLGSLAADGLQTTYNGGVSGEQLYTYSNIPIDVYTRAASDLTSSTNTIALTNFLYKGGSTSTATAFTTSYAKMYSNWAKAPQGSSNEADIDLSLTVPFGTNPGSYATTVYFSAVSAGSTTAPTTP
ncbi:hypothetical protein [Methanobacterium paludis]|uniref:Uncharacterized protein n=1 Tax=Methanobacterium paludis (strain DSM 25820 / JCM 18151 / SWAN1) TaxID=868131 RepID=F6D7S8_METPW|nr:hypothetical protein [Methanobacterium paludis]AEG17766.1 hypothetical protein MSWAN_0733 [Methanobacterium paludis]